MSRIATLCEAHRRYWSNLLHSVINVLYFRVMGYKLVSIEYTQAPYYCPATNNCKLCLLRIYYLDVDFVSRPFFLMDRDCIEKSIKCPGESYSTGNNRARAVTTVDFKS